MKVTTYIKTSIAAAAVALSVPAPAQQTNAAAEAPVRITVKIDSAAVSMAGRTNMHVEVLKPAGAGKMLNLPEYTGEKGQVLEFGGAEVRDITVDSTALPNGRMQVNYNIQLQTFTPGNLAFPPFAVALGTDTFYSEATTLKVLEPPMPKEMRDSLLINPNEGVVSIKARWYDYVPDYWYWFPIGIAALALIVLIIILYRKNGPTLLPRKRVIPPHVLALKRLDELQKRHLAESGYVKAYYTELTDILRSYLAGNFGINALEMSSTEILQAIDADKNIPKEWRERIAQMLATADYVKFAKMQPLPQENKASYDTVRNFVEDTKPKEPDPDSPEGKALARKRRKEQRYDARVERAMQKKADKEAADNSKKAKPDKAPANPAKTATDNEAKPGTSGDTKA